MSPVQASDFNKEQLLRGKCQMCQRCAFVGFNWRRVVKNLRCISCSLLKSMRKTHFKVRNTLAFDQAFEGQTNQILRTNMSRVRLWIIQSSQVSEENIVLCGCWDHVDCSTTDLFVNLLWGFGPEETHFTLCQGAQQQWDTFIKPCISTCCKV